MPLTTFEHKLAKTSYLFFWGGHAIRITPNGLAVSVGVVPDIGLPDGDPGVCWLSQWHQEVSR